jgi:hypothetical protein
MTQVVCKDCKAPLSFRGKSKRKGELLLICSNGHKWQSRGVGLYRTNWKRPESKVFTGVRVYPADWEKLKAKGLSIQQVLDDAIRRILSA